MRVDEDKAFAARRKRLKKFKESCNSTTEDKSLSATSNSEIKRHTQTNATSSSNHQISSRDDYTSSSGTEMVTLDSNSSVAPDSNSSVAPEDSNRELSSVERTLRLLARHEERLELF